jgi:hypothetical protein
MVTRNYYFIDRKVENGIPYEYQIEDVEFDNDSKKHGIIEVTPQKILPKYFKLYGNYPNPFNPVTTIKYDLPVDTRLDLAIYNIKGQRIVTLVSPNKGALAGPYTIIWDSKDHAGRKVASGLYLLRMNTPRFNAIRKMVLTK